MYVAQGLRKSSGILDVNRVKNFVGRRRRKLNSINVECKGKRRSTAETIIRTEITPIIRHFANN